MIKKKLKKDYKFQEEIKLLLIIFFNLIHNSKKLFIDNGVINQAHLLKEDFDFELWKERYKTKIKTIKIIFSISVEKNQEVI